MKKSKRLVTIMLTFCMMVLFSGIVKAENIITVPVTVKENYTEASAFVNYLNEKRVAAGKTAFQIDSRLMEAALQRAAETCVYWSHYSPLNDGEDGAYRTLSDVVGEEYVYIGENIAVGIGNAEGVYTVWESSPFHNAVLASNKTSYCGAAYVEYCNTGYWVFITSDIRLGNIITAPTGTKTKTRSVQVAASLLDRGCKIKCVS